MPVFGTYTCGLGCDDPAFASPWLRCHSDQQDLHCFPSDRSAKMIDPRIQRSFDAQALMTTFGARITAQSAGKVEISAPILPLATQQHSVGHAGLTFSLADTAAGYAALTLMPEGREVMTAEAKINLLAPAHGDMLIARGEVVRAGRRLTVVRADVFALRDGVETCIAILQGTMVSVDPV